MQSYDRMIRWMKRGGAGDVQGLKSKSESHSGDFGLAGRGWGSRIARVSCGGGEMEECQIFQWWIWDTTTTTPSIHCLQPPLPSSCMTLQTRMHRHPDTAHMCRHTHIRADARMHGLTHTHPQTHTCRKFGGQAGHWARSNPLTQQIRQTKHPQADTHM